MLSELIKSQQDIPTLLASIIVMMGLHLVTTIGKFVWSIYKKKSELSAKNIEILNESLKDNTKAIERLDIRIQETEKTLAEIPKFKSDLKRLFIAVKVISGDKWSEVYRIIRDEERDL